MAALPITRVGAASADAASVTIPVGHQAGDLMILYAFRSSVGVPTLGVGWTGLNSGSAGATSFRLAYKRATSSAETSGTWTNATGVIVAVYRGASAVHNPTKDSVATGTSANVSWLTLIQDEPVSSWLLAMGGIVTTTSTIESPPAGMTNISNTVGATCEYVAHDTNGVYSSNGAWPTTVVAVGTSAEWRTTVVEIYAEQQPLPNNYQFIKVANGMSSTERIK